MQRIKDTTSLAPLVKLRPPVGDSVIDPRRKTEAQFLPETYTPPPPVPGGSRANA
jgi:hypothetical protein